MVKSHDVWMALPEDRTPAQTGEVLIPCTGGVRPTENLFSGSSWQAIPEGRVADTSKDRVPMRSPAGRRCVLGGTWGKKGKKVEATADIRVDNKHTNRTRVQSLASQFT